MENLKQYLHRAFVRPGKFSRCLHIVSTIIVHSNAVAAGCGKHQGGLDDEAYWLVIGYGGAWRNLSVGPAQRRATVGQRFW